MPTESYHYLSRHLAKCMTINSCGPVRTRNKSTQNMSNSKMSSQKIPNLYAYSTDDSK